jgi:hypothetical protein
VACVDAAAAGISGLCASVPLVADGAVVCRTGIKSTIVVTLCWKGMYDAEKGGGGEEN